MHLHGVIKFEEVNVVLIGTVKSSELLRTAGQKRNIKLTNFFYLNTSVSVMPLYYYLESCQWEEYVAKNNRELGGSGEQERYGWFS